MLEGEHLFSFSWSCVGMFGQRLFFVHETLAPFSQDERTAQTNLLNVIPSALKAVLASKQRLTA